MAASQKWPKRVKEVVGENLKDTSANLVISTTLSGGVESQSLGGAEHPEPDEGSADTQGNIDRSPPEKPPRAMNVYVSNREPIQPRNRSSRACGRR